MKSSLASLVLLIAAACVTSCGGGGDSGALEEMPARLDLVAGATTYPGDLVLAGRILVDGTARPIVANGGVGLGNLLTNAAALADGSVILIGQPSIWDVSLGAGEQKILRVTRHGDVTVYPGFSQTIGCGVGCVRETYVSVGGSPSGKAYVYAESSANVTVFGTSGIEAQFPLDIPRTRPDPLLGFDTYRVTPLAADANGILYFFGKDGLMRRQHDGALQLVSADPRLERGALAVDRAGNAYAGGRAIHKVAPDGSVSLLAGSLAEAGALDARGANARFREITALAVDRDGSLYATDSFPNDAVRKITPTGDVTTAVGGLGDGRERLGDLSVARLNTLRGVAVAYPAGLWIVGRDGVLFAGVKGAAP